MNSAKEGKELATGAGGKGRFKVESIPSSETWEWLLKKHYAHRIPSISYAFGLYEDLKLCGVCTFGMPASPYLCVGVAGEQWKDKVIELNRLCVESDEKNITSWFVSNCLKHLNSFIVVSYADTQQGHVGKIYQACNFIYTGASKERTDIYAGEGLHSRHYDKSIDYSDNRVSRSSKHRYIYITGNKKFRREALKNLKYEIQPYPKGDTQRYDASYKPIVQGVMF